MLHEDMQKRIVNIYEYMPVMKELITQGKKVSFTITGNSMSPFMIHGRDQVLIEQPSGQWKKGDIGFFQRENGAYILHRICRIDSCGNCWFVGDGQTNIEGPIRPQQIFGKITAVKRKGKWVRAGSFWWEFFEHVWIRIVPFRPLLCRIYGIFKKIVRI